mgnify:CR=1 FL=1
MKYTQLIQAFYNWYRRTIRNAKYRWLIILGTLGYLLLPFDIAPDFIPVIGWIDDGILVTLLVTEVSQMMMEQLNKRRVSRDSQTTADAPPIDVPVEETVS